MASDNGRVQQERHTEDSIQEPDKSRFVGDHDNAARGNVGGEQSRQDAGGTQAGTELEKARGLAEWWRDWWWRRTGYAGIAVPAALGVFWWLVLGWPAFLLGAGLGLATMLLWSKGTRNSKIGGAAIAAIPLYPVVLLAAPWLITVGILAGVVWLIAKNKKAQPDGPYQAHWAESTETEDMKMSVGGDEEKAGIVLGEKDGELIGVYPGFGNRKEMGHVLVVGPSRSGKSLHLETNLLLWPDSVIVNDIKGSIYVNTASYREEHFGSKIEVLDPSGRGSRYDPFYELSYRPEALRTAATLIMKPEEEARPIFAQRAVDGVYAAALAARIEGAPTLPYILELTEEGPKEFVERLNSLGNREIRRAVTRLVGAKLEEVSDEFYQSNAFFQSSWSSMTTKLQPFFSDGILKMCGGNDFEAADLVGDTTTLYLMFSESELRYTKEVYQVIVMALITGLIRHGDINPESAKEIPLLLALDEAGRTPIPQLDDMVSTISGRGMSAVIYVQSNNQLDDSYDEKRASTIRENCHTKLHYKPEDNDTAAYISRMSGQTSIVDVSVSRSDAPLDLYANRSRSWRERELITEDEVRQSSEENVFAFVGKKPPIRAQRLKWFDLFPEAAQFARNNPPTEPEELSLPENLLADRDGYGGSDARRAIAEEPEGEPSSDGPSEDGDRSSRESRKDGGSGYIEPDV